MPVQKPFSIQCIPLLLVLFFPCIAWATDFYLDPVHGSMEGSGTKTDPWSSLEDVWNSKRIQTQVWKPSYSSSPKTLVIKNPNAPVKPGDTLYLLSGHHGNLKIIGANNSDWITIKAEAGEHPTFGRIFLRSASNWAFEGISISPSYIEPYNKKILFLVESHNWTGPSSNISIKNSVLFGKEDVSGWNAEDWLHFAPGAIHTEAEHTVIENVSIFHVHNGVKIEKADHTTIKNCTINKISGDGIQNDGSSYVTIEGNTIKNIYTVDKSHKDMIQAWTFGPPIKGMEIRVNTLILTENDQDPLLKKVQGIGMFDGWYEESVVENNVIVTNTHHGISFYGARDCRIINNTVLSLFNSSIEPIGAPIRVYPHKNGTEGSGNIIRNNFATDISTTDRGLSGGALVDHNIIINDYAHFIDPTHFDFRLKEGSSAIDSGSSDLSPMVDILQIPRDRDTPDIGAYEYGE